MPMQHTTIFTDVNMTIFRLKMLIYICFDVCMMLLVSVNFIDCGLTFQSLNLSPDAPNAPHFSVQCRQVLKGNLSKRCHKLNISFHVCNCARDTELPPHTMTRADLIGPSLPSF